MMTSKAEIRSEATMSRRPSPASYSSRTLPDETAAAGGTGSWGQLLQGVGEPVDVAQRTGQVEGGVELGRRTV